MTDFSAPSLNKACLKLHPLLQTVLELSMEQLDMAVQRLLDAVDDHFFDLAEEAKSNTEQNFYFEAMRDVRIGRRGVEQSFRQNLENGFRAMCFIVDECKDEAKIPPVLTEVSADGLEEVISRIDRKFRAIHGAELYKVTIRLDAISDAIQVVDENNALTPKNLCKYFDRSSQLLNLDEKSQQVLFKLFDRNVIRALPKLLQQVNSNLAEAGVLPEFNEQLSSSVNEEMNQTPVSQVKKGEAENSAEAFSHLQKLLANDADNSGEKDKSSVNQGQTLPQQELLEVLSSMQRNIPLPTGLDAQLSRADIREQIRKVLADRHDLFEGGLISQEDEEVITLVEKLFNAILRDGELSDLVKASLGRLEIPMVKLGLIDRSLFVEREHVGRTLVNELARLGSGDKNKSEIARNVLYTKVEEITQRIVREFNEDVTVFESAYHDLLLFYRRTEARAEEMEHRTRIASEGQEKLALARSVISQNIDLLKKDKVIPSVVDRLLNDGWSKLMLVTLLKEEVPGHSWGDYLLTAEELIWSVQPNKDRSARQRLLQLVPYLLQKLKEGLAVINFEAFALSEILTELEQVHLAIFGMQRGPIAELESSNVNANTSDAANEIFQGFRAKDAVDSVSGDIASITRQILNKSEQRRLGKADEPELKLEANPVDVSVTNVTQESSEEISKKSGLKKHEAETLVDQLNLGVWFEVYNKEAKGKYRCKLAAHLTGYNKYIFVNRRGEKVMERSRNSLVEALVTEEMKVLQETQVFDRALQSVVSDLRNAKGTQN